MNPLSSEELFLKQVFIIAEIKLKSKRVKRKKSLKFYLTFKKTLDFSVQDTLGISYLVTGS